MKDKDVELIKKIREKCSGEFNIEYFTHDIIQNELKEELRNKANNKNLN